MSHKFLKLSSKLTQTGKNRLSEDNKTEIKEAVQSNKEFIRYCLNKTSWTDQEHDDLKVLLDIAKNENGYYKDIYGQRVSHNGIRTLRKPNTELDTSEIHDNEIQKCRDSFVYFRKHYCLIATKSGLARPEPRPYQAKLEQELLSMDDIVVLYPRQSGKTVSSGTYLLWRALFHDTMINIGIVANRPKTAREVLDKIKKIFLELPIWMKTGIEIWNKSEIEFENGTRIMTDGPSSDSFRGYTVNIIFIDEAAYIPKNKWDEFVDSVMPTRNSLIFKQAIYTSTANGMNHFEKMVKMAKLSDTPERFVSCSWREVPHYDKDGNILDPDVYKKMTIRKFGTKFFNQTEKCQFLGSSDTLVSGEALKLISDSVLKSKTVHQNVLNTGDMYQEVQPGHSYICSVDSSKDGIDDFSLNVIDVTSFPFEQVFSANLQVDYLVMPEHLNELGIYYNQATMIIENNEGAGQSIADTLFSVYEYENMYRDKNIGKSGFKKFPGFRTTTKTRPLILNMLKIFLEEDKLIIHSQVTLNQLYTFTKRKTGIKYEAEDGYKDDAVMSLALMFAPFMHIKVFDDFALFIKELRVIDSELQISEVLSILDIGSIDDGSDDDQEEQRRLLRLEMQGIEDYGLSD